MRPRAPPSDNHRPDLRWEHVSHLAMASKTHPLPFSDVLRDLALMRASDLDLSTLLPPTSSTLSSNASDNADETQALESIVERSYEFAQEARKAIKILNREAVDTQGANLENVRSQLEDVLKGLE